MKHERRRFILTLHVTPSSSKPHGTTFKHGTVTVTSKSNNRLCTDYLVETHGIFIIIVTEFRRT